MCCPVDHGNDRIDRIGYDDHLIEKEKEAQIEILRTAFNSFEAPTSSCATVAVDFFEFNFGADWAGESISDEGVCDSILSNMFSGTDGGKKASIDLGGTGREEDGVDGALSPKSVAVVRSTSDVGWGALWGVDRAERGLAEGVGLCTLEAGVRGPLSEGLLSPDAATAPDVGVDKAVGILEMLLRLVELMGPRSASLSLPYSSSLIFIAILADFPFMRGEKVAPLTSSLAFNCSHSFKSSLCLSPAAINRSTTAFAFSLDHRCMKTI